MARIREDSLIEMVEVTDFSKGEKAAAEQPDNFQRIAIRRDLAAEVEAGGAGRTHPQLAGDARQNDVRNRMVLEGESHVENRMPPDNMLFTDGSGKFGERHRVGEAIQRDFRDLLEMLGKTP